MDIFKGLIITVVLGGGAYVAGKLISTINKVNKLVDEVEDTKNILIDCVKDVNKKLEERNEKIKKIRII